MGFGGFGEGVWGLGELGRWKIWGSAVESVGRPVDDMGRWVADMGMEMGLEIG